MFVTIVKKQPINIDVACSSPQVIKKGLWSSSAKYSIKSQKRFVFSLQPFSWCQNDKSMGTEAENTHSTLLGIITIDNVTKRKTRRQTIIRRTNNKLSQENIQALFVLSLTHSSFQINTNVFME